METLGSVHPLLSVTPFPPGALSGITRIENALSAAPATDMAPIEIVRGIRPALLISQVRNTVPWLFAEMPEFLRPLEMENPEAELSHAEYFHLCIAAHWATVGSFVPTDVEAQIRFRLWSPALNFGELDRMAEIVLEAYRWDTTRLSKRFVKSLMSGETITGHRGEWFSIAVAAYAANRVRNPARAAEVLEKIQFEVTRQAKVYLEFKRVRDGLGLLKAATLIAHNLGDLDRVIETWGLEKDPTDPVVEFAYRAAHESGSRALRFSGALAEAGRLNRAYMTSENHRHFPLRLPRALRRSADLLLPVAPFFDEWGEALALHPEVKSAELAEVVDALVTGWEKLKGPEGKTITYAYPRAIAGILEKYPGGMAALSTVLPPGVERSLRSGLFRSLVSVPRSRFEEQWAQMALNFVK